MFHCPSWSLTPPHPSFTASVTTLLVKHLSYPSWGRQLRSFLPLRLMTFWKVDEQHESPGSPNTEVLNSMGYPSTGKSEDLVFFLPSRLLGRLLRSWIGKLALNWAGFWQKPAWQASLEMCLCFVRRFVKTDTFPQNVLILINQHFRVGKLFSWKISDHLCDNKLHICSIPNCSDPSVSSTQNAHADDSLSASLQEG